MNTVLAEKLVNDLLDPEMFGHAVNSEIRDRARECIGLQRVETIDYATRDEFTKWLYETYTINNGHRLTQLEEDEQVLLNYLSDMGLPADTELKD
jgi:hypothetical protein